MTNIEYDVMARPNSSVEDMYTGSVLGELGCWVDSSITRMVQTGVEHSRVPSVCSYMNIGWSLFYLLFGLELTGCERFSRDTLFYKVV